ncbi:MAG TPA: hypothetical protein ENG03_02705 [Thioploca sp.]|nr:MAG: hypothetical protein DRR19_04610 [Gammaproteobacteria bacterium]HDN26006.1 hypothetical protein [Thioploca sp.]
MQRWKTFPTRRELSGVQGEPCTKKLCSLSGVQGEPCTKKRRDLSGVQGEPCTKKRRDELIYFIDSTGKRSVFLNFF